MADYFGASTGILQGLENNRAQESHLAEMALAPIKQQEAQLRLGEAQRGARSAQEFAEAARQLMGEGKSGSPSETLASLATAAAGAGLPDKAQSLSVAAAQASARESIASQRAESEAATASKTRLQELHMVGQIAKSVKNAADWEKGKMLYQMQTGKGVPKELEAYDPRMVEILGEQAMTEAEKLKAETAAFLAKTKDERQNSAEAVDKARAEELRARAEKDRAQARNADKHGGTGAGKAPKADLGAVTDLIQNAYDLPDKVDARVLARPIADRAVEIRKNNPNITSAQAAQQAYSEARSAGAFASLRVKPGQRPKGDATQRSLVEQYGQKYDSAYEYKVLPNGSLARKKRAQ